MRLLGQVGELLAVIPTDFTCLTTGAIARRAYLPVDPRRRGESGMNPAGGRVNNASFIAFHPECNRSGGEEKRDFEIVLGADGADSTVHKSLGIDFEGYTHKRQWSITDAEITSWPYEPGAAQAFTATSASSFRSASTDSARSRIRPMRLRIREAA
ncbi:hypothetical protein [Mesorhizobium silamurunense]|uniref:hypothetical protein n=1 Tax=Mesorhizobium silamurunense TaxID=499528 RepID=UPI00177CF8AF|nr:hypothetical protein [Mesorhizobium silamurunense]